MTTVTKEPSMYKRALLALVAACGYQDPVAEQPDAPVPVDGESDAPPDVPQALGAFGAPQFVAELNTPAADDDPETTEDGLELFLASNRPGGIGAIDIWTARRTSTTDVWSAPELVAELSSTTSDTHPNVSADGLRMYFSSSRAGSGRDIYVSARATRSAAWAPPAAITELNTVAAENRVSVTADELVLVLESDRGNTGRDLYLSTRSSTSNPWSAPAPVTELNSSATDGDPMLSADGLTVYFTRSGEILVAVRSSRAESFAAPTRVDELSSTFDDQDPWISADQRTFLFASDRSGNRDIYIATR